MDKPVVEKLILWLDLRVWYVILMFFFIKYDFEWLQIGTNTVHYSEDHGLIFRSFMYLFQQIQEQPSTHFILKASYLEIYNEKVTSFNKYKSGNTLIFLVWSRSNSTNN